MPKQHQISSIALRLAIAIALIGLAPMANGQGKTKIKLIGAQSMKNLKMNGQTIVRHIGNVRFAHGDTRISCDSSYMNSATNSFDAYGHVVITQEDTRITGDMLHFEGNTSTATVWGKIVQMLNQDNTLTTNFLRYNTKQKYATYTTGGYMHTPDFDLSSQHGHMFTDKNIVAFAKSVIMHNPDTDCFTDSLVYDMSNKKGTFIGPSFIFSDSCSIYCELGTYIPDLKQATASQRAYMLRDSYKLFGNTIFLDDSTGYAYAQGNVIMIDTANQMSAYGQQAHSWERGKRMVLSDQPFVTMVDGPDTLFLRADTLFIDEMQSPIHPDSTYRLLRGVGSVRFHRADLQGLCDTLRYANLDSLAHMVGNPILWQQNNQITANTIVGHFKDDVIDYAHFKGNAFMVTEETPNEHYSQMRGKDIDALFKRGVLHTVNVLGNCQAVYYMRDNNEVSTVNRIESDNAVIGIRNNQITRLRFNKQPKSDLFPIEQANPEQMTLSGFKWHGDKRPIGRSSILPQGAQLLPVETGTQRRLELQELLASGVSLINTDLRPISKPRTIMDMDRQPSSMPQPTRRNSRFQRR